MKNKEILLTFTKEERKQVISLGFPYIYNKNQYETNRNKLLLPKKPVHI